MDDEIEELRRQTEKGDRIDERTGGEDGSDLVDAILEELDGQETKTVSVWSPPIAALVSVMEDQPVVRERLAAALGIDEPGSAERSDVLKAILREGISGADPELWESVREAYAEHTVEEL